MIRVAFIRHAPTTWNAERRLQGRTDIDISDVGRRAAAAWRLPDEIAAFEVWSSPLARTRSTAALLGLEPRFDDRLIESSWGEWEGRTLADLGADPGFRHIEERGLDLAAPGGESVRQVQARLVDWLSSLSAPALAITHNGVLRAAYALATGWTMTEKPPVKMRAACAHLYAWDGRRLTLERLNLPLAP